MYTVLCTFSYNCLIINFNLSTFLCTPSLFLSYSKRLSEPPCGPLSRAPALLSQLGGLHRSCAASRPPGWLSRGDSYALAARLLNDKFSEVCLNYLTISILY